MTLRLKMLRTVHEVDLRPQGRRFPVVEGGTILKAAFGQNVVFPDGCKIGRCSLCKSRLIEGEVLHDVNADIFFTGGELIVTNQEIRSQP